MPEASVMAKARCAEEVRGFIDIPNVGPATAGDFARLGLRAPAELVGCDAFALYRRLCDTDGVRHDPCVIDVFLSAVDQANGGAPVPWWEFTPLRKKLTTASAAVARAGASRKRPTRAASARTR